MRDQDSSVGTETGYGLDCWGSIPGRGKIFFFSINIQTGSDVHPASYPKGIQQPGHEADNSPPTSAKIKNGGAISPFSHMSSWHSA
jgi:hypothetical protein